ncbi:MAG: IS1595 family transposase [Acidobacteriia bacterium]|nr:IS1595 family transposase [Terriglobia bacterium]
MAHEPKTLQEAIAYFSDPERAFQYAVKMRFPDGRIYCPRCGAEKFSFIKTRRIWFCYACKKQFTVKVKTIMEDSALGLDKWMVAIWMLANCKNGISSHELARSLGITQKSAWFMLQRIREALKERSFGGTKLGGSGSEVEADETFVGGKASNMHTGRRKAQEAKGPLMNKTIVQGMYDRELRKVRCTVIPNVRRDTLQNMLLKNIKYGSTVYTDNAVGYDKVSYNFVHDVINHTQEYVRGRVHTNSIENFWSLLKRGLKGTYVCVEPFHLSRYVDEQVFRFNNRKEHGHKITDAERFAAAMSGLAGRRLTYSDLTGKSDSPHHEATGTRTEVQEPF